MNTQAPSTDFGTELANFIHSIGTFDSFARNTQFGPDAVGQKPGKRRGMLRAAKSATVDSVQVDVGNDMQCPGSIRRLCGPASPVSPASATTRRSSIARVRKKATHEEPAPRVLVSDGSELYDVTVLTPEIVRSCEWKLVGDRTGTWAVFFGPKSRYIGVSSGQQIDKLRAYLSSLPKTKMRAAIDTAQKASMACGPRRLKGVTIHALFMNSQLQSIWTNVHLRLRPIPRPTVTQTDGDIWTLVDSLGDIPAIRNASSILPKL
jgi:hypothetical protein